jgi:hypothetical protein
MVRRLALAPAILSVFVVACGGSGSAPSPTPPPAAVIAVSNFTASVTGTGTGVVYHAAFHLTETSGKVGANITSFAFTFSNGGTATVTGNAVHMAAGGSTDTGTINMTDSSGRAVSSQLSVSVAFTDDNAKAGTATSSTAISQVVLVTLSGTIADSASGAGIAGATVRAVSGVNTGVVATSDGSGHYALTPLVAGSFLIDVTAPGYVSKLSQSIGIDRDTAFNIALTKLAPVAPNVEYRITGSARRCSATYENSTGGTNQAEVNIPFSYSWSGAKSGDFLYMSCQIDTGGDSGSILVEIYKNGGVSKSATAIGFPNIATASGSY